MFLRENIVQRVTAVVQFGGDDLNEFNALMVSGVVFPPSRSSCLCSPTHLLNRCVAVGVQFAEGDELSPFNNEKLNRKQSESSLKSSPAIFLNFAEVQ